MSDKKWWRHSTHKDYDISSCFCFVIVVDSGQFILNCHLDLAQSSLYMLNSTLNSVLKMDLKNHQKRLGKIYVFLSSVIRKRNVRAWAQDRKWPIRVVSVEFQNGSLNWAFLPRFLEGLDGGGGSYYV